MILVFIGIACVAAWLAWGTVLFIPALVVALASFWSNGVLANFRHDPQAAPDWAAAASMITALASVGLLIASLFIR